MNRQPQRAAGFSLLETLVAMMIGGMIALSIAGMMVSAIGTSNGAQELTELTAEASDTVEYLNSLPFTHEELIAGGSIDKSVDGYAIDPVNGDPNLYIRWQVIDEGMALKRIVLVAGVRDSTAGPSRETRVETFRVATE